MRSFVIFILLVGVYPALSQNSYLTDSLLQVIEEPIKDDSLLFEVYRKISFNHPQPLEGLDFGLKALELANHRKNRARAFFAIALNYRLIGNLESSLSSSYKALSIFEELGNSKMKAASLLQIAETHVSNSQIQASIPYFLKARNEYIFLDDYYRLATIYVNLGEAYRLSNQLDSAEATFQKALLINDSIQNPIIEAYATGNLGMVHRTQNKLAAAQSELNTAIHILTDLGDPASIVIYQAEIGQILIANGDGKNGIGLIEEAFIEAEENRLKEQLRDLSKALANAYVDEGDYKRAFHYQKVHQVYKDSLLNADNIRSMEQTKAQYELDKKDSEIALYEMNISSQKAKIRLIAIISILLIILLIMIYLGYRNNLKSNKLLSDKNKIIQKQSDEKELLYREMHHRVKNNLQLISSIMGLNARSTSDKGTSHALKSSQSRMEAMSLIHNSLYDESKGSHINFNEYVSKLVANLKATYNDQIEEIRSFVPDITLLADDCIPIGLILNECVCNSVKYKTSDRINIDITLDQNRSGGFILSIKDDGTGFESNSKGFGSHLIETLASQLRAVVNINTSKIGTEVILEMDHLVVMKKAISA